MRIERVTAHAFGPLEDEELELAPGMTVVVGPNEAGKSSWHAAIRAAVCGVRRGRGRATTVDAAFEEHHRPWDRPERWAAEARLSLDDGRTIDISQDLAGKVACRATDVVLGRDVSAEIMDGTPDASRWLGLDRDAFAATVCVNQAQILAVAEKETASALQEHMQRAAATRGTDATAAEARDRLTRFRRDRVGVDRVGSRGPLRAARLARDGAEAGLADARRRHLEYLERSAELDAATRAVGIASRRTAAVEAASARRRADEIARRAERATQLAGRHPTAPPGMAARDEHADAVASAIDAWAARPRIEPPAGASSAELEAELDAMPPAPDGDLVVHGDVAEARRRLDLAIQAMDLQGPRPETDRAESEGPDEQTLRSLARRIRTPEPEVDPRIEAELAEAHAQLADGSDAGASGLLVGAGAILGASVLAVVLGYLLVAGVLVVAAAAIGGFAWRRRSEPMSDAAERVARAEAAMAPLRAAREHARRERQEAEVQAAASGLPVDAVALDELAERRATAERKLAAGAEWDRVRTELEHRRLAAAGVLAVALDARGVDATGDAMAAFDAYVVACHERADQAAAAASRDGIRRALDARRAAEAAARDAVVAVERAERSLRVAADAVGTAKPDATPDELVTDLEAWRARRVDELRGAAEALAEWQELTALLGDESLDGLRAAAAERAARAEHLAAGVDPRELAELAGREDLELLIGMERDEQIAAERDANSRAGALEQMRRELPDVAEQEERLADAAAELRGVEALANVVDETLRLLRAAEEKVHRDLAPILAEAIRRWLPKVSGGKYVDATVDPADLSVTVKEASGGRWRRAMLLSAGAREQIYLLLRVAMAQHLVVTGEIAPLLLDEVTAQADRERRRQLLEMLHEISSERQVILFTHDHEVAAWAEDALDSRKDRLVYLERVRVQRRPMLVAS